VKYGEFRKWLIKQDTILNPENEVFDLKHSSKIEFVEAAAKVLGTKLAVSLA
jgi:hypothetical protein